MVLWKALVLSEWPSHAIAKKLKSPGSTLLLCLCIAKVCREGLLHRSVTVSTYLCLTCIASLPITLHPFWLLLLLASVLLQCGLGGRASKMNGGYLWQFGEALAIPCSKGRTFRRHFFQRNFCVILEVVKPSSSGDKKHCQCIFPYNSLWQKELIYIFDLAQRSPVA